MSKTNFNNETQFIFSNEFIGFTTIPNYIFQCKDLSFKAVGIYCSILQYQNSPTHKISIKGLMSIHSDGERSIRSGLDELLAAGFLTREQIRENGKIKGYLYTVYMKPIDNTDFSPKRQNVDMENVDLQNVVNKKENINKENINKENISSSSVPSEKIEDDDLKEVINLYKECINNKLSSNTKDTLKELLSIYGKDHVLSAIKITMNKATSPNLAYLKKVCSTDSTSMSTTSNNTTNTNKFITTYSHNWDMEMLQRNEQAYIERVYGK